MTLRRECACCACCCRARACRSSGRRAACRGRSTGWPRRRDASESGQSTGGAGRDVVREPFCALRCFCPESSAITFPSRKSLEQQNCLE
eukprot:4121834-Prymnesium_polylepis.1